MEGEFLHAVTQVDQAEVAGADVATVGGDDEFAAASEHVHAHVVHVGARHTLGAAHADVVGGAVAAEARAVRAQQIVPAVAID